MVTARGPVGGGVMRAYGLPVPLRLIDARVLTSRRATVIRRLALMNPSTLAQASR